MINDIDGKTLLTYPEWTEYRKKNGLDPLGMQNSSVSLYQTFLPGISNVTLRMRYYGLYAWLAHKYASNVGDTDPNRWKRYIRRAEALYALIASNNGNETGIAGIEWASLTLLERQDEHINFSEAAEPGSETYYLKQAWGAFGAAYRSQLFEIGIFDSSHVHEIPLPSKPLGEGLADAFSEALGSLADTYFKLIEKGSVTITELDDLALLLPSAITPKSAEERYYQNILVAQDGVPAATALSRKLSIQLVLKIADLLAREPHPNDIRWILYAGYDQEGRPLKLNDATQETHRLRWWVYHANDLCHIAYEAILKYVLDTLGNHLQGLSLSRLIETCVDGALSEFDQEPESWEELVHDVQPEINAFDIHKPNAEIVLAGEIMRAGRDDTTICTSATAAKAIQLVALLHRRIGDMEIDLHESLGGYNPVAFRSLLSEVNFLDMQSSETFRRTIEKIFEERVIRRHLWIALRKLRYQGDYTFLIETDDGKLRLREKDGPVFTNPRLGPTIKFLRDAGFLSDAGPTPQGREAANA